jgi:hypothetical protein
LATRARSVVLQALGRTAILLVWALVGWGVLLVASALANAFGEGPAVAFARLLPAGDPSIWGWLGPLSVLLTLGAGLVGVALAIRGRGVWGVRSPPQNKKS